MRRRALLVLTLWLVAPLAAAPPKTARKPAPAPSAEAKLIQSCDAHKFETVVDTMVEGQSHKSKVKLCGVEGQSDAEWIGTLKDAIRKLEANKGMAVATRDQIVTAIKAEIARLSIVGAPVPSKREAQELGTASRSSDYAALPPIPPAAEPPPVRVAPATPVQVAAAETPAPLPAGGAPAVVAPPSSVQSAPVPASPLSVAVPRLTFSCEAPSDLAGPAPCAEFERETLLTIKADGEVPAGVALQFVRNGRNQGDLSLDGLGKRGSLRAALPRGVCAGFGAGRLELRVVQSGEGQPAQSEGPFALRC